ncbi:MAG: hypothetical protein HUU55_00795 [Myxococcales bacterium]|nr:hypothetical protein [Myxococcales bacterium]
MRSPLFGLFILAAWFLTYGCNSDDSSTDMQSGSDSGQSSTDIAHTMADNSTADSGTTTDDSNPSENDADTPKGDLVATSDVAELPDMPDEPQGPPPLEQRGFMAVRAAIHVHSAYSHDGCDGDGLLEDGTAKPECIDNIRHGICVSRLNYVLMTDHPANMRDYPFEKLVFYDPTAGDELVWDDNERAWANRLMCPDGVTKIVTVGFEGTHTMAVGLKRHLVPKEMHSISIKDETTPEDLQAVVAEVHAAGGLQLIAHSEQDDLSAEVLISLPIDGMEMYNVHANFNSALEKKPERLFLLEPYFDPAPGGPDPDLAALLLLDVFPTPSLDKWRTVVGAKQTTGVIGSDVHENVNVSGYCDPGGSIEGLCDALGADVPYVLAALKKGGPVIMEDGERLDSYRRVFHWLHNRLLVTEFEPGADQEAIVAGRNIAVFEVLGDPAGLDVVAQTTDGIWHEIGSRVPRSGNPILWIQVPPSPVPTPGVAWADAQMDAAELTVTIWHLTEGKEPAKVWESTQWGEQIHYAMEEVGAYQVELTMRPKHLLPWLTPNDDLAESTYRWAEVNPIYVY